MIMNFFEILSNGFSSVLGGLFTALAVAGGLLYLLAVNSRRGLQPIAAICCALLFCFLFYQTTLMYAAISEKSDVLNFISALHLQFGNQIDGETLRQTIVPIIEQNPVVSFFVDYTNLEDFDWSQPIVSARTAIAREFNWFIFRRIVWSAVFIIIFGGVALMTLGSTKRSRRLSNSYDEVYSSESSDNYDF